MLIDTDDIRKAIQNGDSTGALPSKYAKLALGLLDAFEKYTTKKREEDAIQSGQSTSESESS